MQSFLIAWRFLLLISTFAFPQLLGILLYYRLTWAPWWLAAIVAALAPAGLFFWLARIILAAGLREAFPEGMRCGMPIVVAIMALYAGTIIHFTLGVVTQAVLAARRSTFHHEVHAN